MNADTSLAEMEAEIATLMQRRDKLRELLVLRTEVSQLERGSLALLSNGEKMNAIAQAICANFGITEALLFGRCRETNLITPRHVYAYLCRELLGATFEVIGRSYRRDHGTVMNSVLQTRNRMDVDREFLNLVNALAAQCRANFAKAETKEQP